MKIRDSGMPPEEQWSGYFSPEETLRKLGLESAMLQVVDLGCGYGTFAVPAAQMIEGRVLALDIDPEMLAIVQAKQQRQGLSRLEVIERDFFAEGTGLPDCSTDFVMLFNLLHAESPQVLIREAKRILRAAGILAVMHWNYEASTPRGPSLEIRPRPEQVQEWILAEGFQLRESRIDLPPYHYGFCAVRT